MHFLKTISLLTIFMQIILASEETDTEWLNDVLQAGSSSHVAPIISPDKPDKKVEKDDGLQSEDKDLTQNPPSPGEEEGTPLKSYEEDTGINSGEDGESNPSGDDNKGLKGLENIILVSHLEFLPPINPILQVLNENNLVRKRNQDRILTNVYNREYEMNMEKLTAFRKQLSKLRKQ